MFHTSAILSTYLAGQDHTSVYSTRVDHNSGAESLHREQGHRSEAEGSRYDLSFHCVDI